ncbi:hypothetical protein [Streptomyces niger]|uniref:hypothetical protein n=1 Tax=Streptomyces niger TaxID=66373 RepID=UPI001F2CBE92|nr:hypothetical protein [Streptomyces niger]
MGKLTAHRTVAVVHRTALVLTSVLCGVSVLAACSHDTRPRPAPSSSAGSPSKKSERAEHIPGESVTKAPKLLDGKPLVTVQSAQGSEVLPLKHRVGSGRLAILINCQGEGKLTVTVDKTGLSFPVECVEREVSSTYNEIHLKRKREEASIQISAPPGIRWSLSVGQ